MWFCCLFAGFQSWAMFFNILLDPDSTRELSLHITILSTLKICMSWTAQICGCTRHYGDRAPSLFISHFSTVGVDTEIISPPPSLPHTTHLVTSPPTHSLDPLIQQISYHDLHRSMQSHSLLWPYVLPSNTQGTRVVESTDP